MDKSVSNESHLIMWAAKFSVGSLNNMIQNQFIAGLKSGNSSKTKSNSYGYGACQPYTGLEIGLARHLVTRERQILAFTLFVRPFDRKTKEVFDIKVSFPIDNQKNQMDFDKFTRASSFNEYELCADKTVNPKICTCRTGHRKPSNGENTSLKKLQNSQFFVQTKGFGFRSTLFDNYFKKSILYNLQWKKTGVHYNVRGF